MSVLVAEPRTVHRAATDPETGWWAFHFIHGPHSLAGQVPSFEEYRSYLVQFQAWAKCDLPAAVPFLGAFSGEAAA